MLKLLVLSIVLATFLLPARAARLRNPRSAFFSLLVTMVLAELGYTFFLYAIYPRLV